MNQQIPMAQLDIQRLRLALKRRMKPALAVFSILLAATVATAIFMPPVYQSSATVLIEQQEIPQDLVRSTVTSFADQRIQMIVQRAMTFARLSEIIKKYNLYPEERDKYPLEQVIEEMRNDTHHRTISAEVVDPRTGRPVEATIAFSIDYLSKSPQLAQQVTNELVSIFLEENLKNRGEMAEQAETFLRDELAKLTEKMKQLENGIAEFKEQNLRSLPEQASLNVGMLERAERDQEDVNRQILTLQERKVYLENQLQQIEPFNKLVGTGEEAVMTIQARVRYLQQRYLSLSSIYAANHPDVLKTRRELDELVGNSDLTLDRTMLEKQLAILRADLNRLRSRYDSQHPEVKNAQRLLASYTRMLNSAPASGDVRYNRADNPAYLQVVSSLESSKIELANLEASRQRLNEKIGTLEASIQQSPLVEKTYRNLTRDLETTSVKYREVKAKLGEAQMARSLERERKAERFTLIEPPLVPERPVKPNRIVILLFGVLVSLGTAAGTVWLLESADSTIRSSSDIRILTGLAPLAEVPHIATAVEISAKVRQNRLVLGSVFILVVGTVLLVHFAYKPLDVLWFVAMRKFG